MNIKKIAGSLIFTAIIISYTYAVISLQHQFSEIIYFLLGIILILVGAYFSVCTLIKSIVLKSKCTEVITAEIKELTPCRRYKRACLCRYMLTYNYNGIHSKIIYKCGGIIQIKINPQNPRQIYRYDKAQLVCSVIIGIITIASGAIILLFS